ncbi:hypothetical protein ASPZODRAFT_147748 [Penicilliopsis zonata CBS 506.65]|uniref:Uncharacterized protein n=1 Tax=Penicilliopsis zonata CBS 506.65 TaxID=1073090 RepID=A0A1L9S4N6_9EURO|nr:hypothetical protein ASPZODRAFT_147748 [Penicilliopsis zonata CBS 506.65]OJJ42122.1 hypothetical protein ASPZODRAFT_147748 [Penicilliopsis zonata CBS 506.65]
MGVAAWLDHVDIVAARCNPLVRRCRIPDAAASATPRYIVQNKAQTICATRQPRTVRMCRCAASGSIGARVLRPTSPGESVVVEPPPFARTALRREHCVIDTLVLSAADFADEKPLLDLGSNLLWRLYKVNVRRLIDMVKGLYQQRNRGPIAKDISPDEMHIISFHPGLIHNAQWATRHKLEVDDYPCVGVARI